MKAKRAEQLDLFVLPLGDIDFRDQQETMESPFFALNKNRKTPLEYGSPKGNIHIKISPNVSHSMATIWDADILIWAAGTVNRMHNQGDKKGLAELDRTRTLHFHPVDLLRSIKRGTSGRDIQELQAALRRLNATYIETNVRQHHQKGQSGFNWIDGWSKVTAVDEDSDQELAVDAEKRIVGFTITLSHWFYMGVVQQRLLLSMEPDYFALTGGYERWLYRVARKHAHGAPEGWSFTLTTLHQKSGSDAPKKAFKRDFKRLAERGGVLGYGIEWTERGRGEDPLIRIYPRPEHERNQQLALVHQKSATAKAANDALKADPNRFRELMKPDVLARIVARHTRVDLDDMLARFVTWNAQRGTTPRNFSTAFEGFLRKHDSSKGE